jgi:SAM-dependent methyltransferase
MPWYYAVAERDHDIQNPTSHEKIYLLGSRLRLGPRSIVLDVACGKAGPALVLARTYGCHIVGIERAEEFATVARKRVSEANLDALVEIVVADAKLVELDPQRYDVAMCLGASFVWDGLAGTLAVLAPATRDGGAVVVGEPYWRRWPPPDGIDAQGYVTLAETVGRFEAAGLAPEGLIASSADDWDRYESLHWRALEDWLAVNADDADAPRIRELHERYRDEYLSWGRDLLGWAIFVGRKR